MRSKKFTMVLVAAMLAGASPAMAEDVISPESFGPPPPPPGQTDDVGRRAKRMEFSGKRFIVESLAGALVGGLVGYGVYTSQGEDFGAAMMGLGANFAVTPLVVYGTGRAMGGEGSLGYTYLGGLCAFAGPSATPEQAAMSLALGSVFLPFTSAVMFEMSSHFKSKKLAAAAQGFSVAPVVNNDGVGVRAGLAFGF